MIKIDSEEKNADRLARIEKILVVIHTVVTKHSVQLENLDSILKDDLVTNFKDIQKGSIDYFNSTLMQTIKALRLENDEDEEEDDDDGLENDKDEEDDDDDSDCSSTESQLSSAKTALRVDKDSEDSFIESHSDAVKEEPVPVTSQGSAQDHTIFNENVAVEPSLTSYGDSQSFAQGDIDIDDWREASARIPIRLLKGVSVCELAESGYYSESELCESYPSGVVHAALMRARGDTATDCKHASLSPNDCLAGGFTTEELVAGGYSETLLGLLNTVPGGALAEAVIASAVRGGGGCGDGASALASPSVSDSDLRMLITCPILADISTTVPDLPVAYMFREGDIKGFKDAVLRDNNTAALTSTKKRQQLMNKVGAYGMGGVGKTTIAIALVHDAEVRTFFDLIVWVSVGQEPDIMELQSSIHWQLTKTDLESGLANHKRVEALRSAGKGRRLLLVVDDLWDASYEKDLNCIDLDTPSKLLVTTRIRGLLKNTSEVEVDVLSQDDARTLLLSVGEMEEGELDKDAYRQANAVVELCGHLPLTLAIAGGMIACNFGLSDDIIEFMKEGHLREQDDEEGLTLEGRIIQSSLTMLKKGKNSDMTLKVFFHFAVFPEDVLVPVDVFFKLASYISGEKNENKARIMVGGCLKELLKYNLVKGSLRVGGDGAVFMHDLVRDFAISRHTGAELHTLHQNSIEVFLGERPLPDGFPIASHASASSYVGYVARHAHVHMRGALRREKEDTLEEPPDAWLAHPDNAIKTNTAMAVGLAALVVLSEAREAEGELVRAAQAVWAASLLEDVSRSALFNDLVHRAAALLERADDTDAKEFELEVLSVAFLADMGTKRNGKAVDRQQALSASSKATFDSRTGEAMAVFMDGMAKMGFLGGEGSIEAALPSFLAHARIVAESKDLAPNKSLQVVCTNWYPAHVIGMAFSASPFEPWHDFGFSEEKLVSGIDFYNFHVCGRILKEQFVKMDSFRYGALTLPLALLYGNLDALDVWYSKTLAAFQEIDLPTSKDYASEILEVAHCLLWCAVPLFVLLRQFANASKLLKAGGFTWSEDGFENFDKWFLAFSAMFPFAQKPNWDLYIRLTIIVTSPSGAIDEVGVKAQIPSPAQITEMERGDNFFRRYGFFDLTSLGALAFLKLGRDDDAYELARLAVAPEQNTEKKSTLVGCYSILGQVAAKRKHPDEADGHFKRALEEGKLSGLPMLEVLAARDWKRVLQAEGRDCSAMEAVIDVACGKMGKSRVQLGSDLVGLRALKGQSI